MAENKDSGNSRNNNSKSGGVNKSDRQGRGTVIERRSQPYEGNAARPPRPPKK